MNHTIRIPICYILVRGDRVEVEANSNQLSVIFSGYAAISLSTYMNCLIMEQYEALLLPNLSFVDIKYKYISFIWLFNQCKASLILSYILLG